jgi:hypothetical protein
LVGLSVITASITRNPALSRRAGPVAIPALQRRSDHSTPAAASSVASTAARRPIEPWNDAGSSSVA